jgi:hypothetical protein
LSASYGGSNELEAVALIKGALVSFMPTFIGSLPNVIVFQYNPETIQHTWTPAAKSAQATDPKAGVNPTAVDDVPGESFSFKVSLDANDMIADGASNPVAAALATASGVYTRLAALEMLQYPSAASPGASLVGSVSASINIGGLSASVSLSASAPSMTVPRSEVPLVLFVWGAQRIVPVRVTALSTNETLYDSSLNPIHAEVSITLRVLTPSEISAIGGELQQIAQVAYTYSQGLRQVQAMANLGDAAASIIGMLPNPF